jgi:hypothetical protein
MIISKHKEAFSSEYTSVFEKFERQKAPNKYLHDIVPTVNLKFKSEIYELLRQDNVQALKITLTTNFL